MSTASLTHTHTHTHTLTVRMYYHSSSCLPMFEDEIQVDSEGEESILGWQRFCSQKVNSVSLLPSPLYRDVRERALMDLCHLSVYILLHCLSHSQ